MVKKDPVTLGGIDFSYVYSDLSVYIRRDKFGGNEELYADAYEPIQYRDVWTYTETDIPIEKPEEPDQNA